MTGTHVDRLLIRELIDLYADVLTHCCWDKLSDLWTEDAYWEALEPFNLSASGRSEVLALTRSARERNGFVAQMPHALVVDSIRGDEATAHHTLHLLSKNRDGSGYSCIGRYTDILARHHGQWQFRRRSFRPMWIDRGSPGGALIELTASPLVAGSSTT